MYFINVKNYGYILVEEVSLKSKGKLKQGTMAYTCAFKASLGCMATSVSETNEINGVPFLLIWPVAFAFLPFPLLLTVYLEFSIQVYANPKKSTNKKDDIKKTKLTKIFVLKCLQFKLPQLPTLIP